jgi:hypothetical protein
MGKKKARKTRKQQKPNRKNLQIFDKLGKIIYQEMSHVAIVNSLIGLFRTDLSPDTSVMFGATESIRERDGRLLKHISDVVMIVGEREFELEFQSSDDKMMGSRMFGYGYAQGERHKPEVSETGVETVYDFPEAVVIYLEPTKNTPDILRIGIRHKGIVIPAYEVQVYRLLDHSLAELEADKLHIFMPFYVMKHRRELMDGKSDSECRKELAQETAAILEEIAEVLERGVLHGIIDKRDMVVLLEKAYLLYRELYGTIAEFKEALMDFEKKFRSKIPDREAEIIRQTEIKILNLFKQGKTVEEVETLLAQKTASDGPQPLMT